MSIKVNINRGWSGYKCKCRDGKRGFGYKGKCDVNHKIKDCENQDVAIKLNVLVETFKMAISQHFNMKPYTVYYILNFLSINLLPITDLLRKS